MQIISARVPMLVSLVFCLLLPPAVAATTFVRVLDADLADQATVIAEVRVTAIDPMPAGAALPVTDYRVEVERLLAGYLSGSSLVVRVAGGLAAEGVALRVYGAPRFALEERALLFLTPGDDGAWRLLHFLQGAFRVVPAGDRELAVRDFSDTREVGLPGRGAEPLEGPRDLARFREWLIDRANGYVRPADYRVEEALPRFTLISSNTTGLAVRWTQFDSGGQIGFRAHEDGQPGVPGGGFAEFQTALAAWNNDPGSDIRYQYGGTIAQATAGQGCNGNNTMDFNDPNNNITDNYSCFSGGTIASTSVCWNLFPTVTHNGTEFHTLVGADIITNSGTGCFFSGGPRRAEEVFAHELGHGLGIAHSCGDSSSGPCNTTVKNQALMRAQAHGDGRGAQLNSDDRAAAAFLYGSGALVAPTGLTANASGPGTVQLSWNDNSDNESQFQIQRKSTGDFATLANVGANSTAFTDDSVLSATTYTYRVRARNGAGASGYSNQASATTPGEPPPTGLHAVSLSTSEIRLTWQDNALGETGFEVFGKTGEDDFTLFQTLGPDIGQTVIDGLPEGTEHTFRVRSVGGSAGDSSFTGGATATTFLPSVPCVAGPTTLCLNDGRFKVELDWLKFDGEEGMGQDVGSGSDDSAVLWFFFPENWEMLVKVIDGCGFNGHFWVFAAAVTNVEYTMTVTDSLTGFSETYFNPLGVSAPAVTDIEAFATCEAAVPGGSEAQARPPAAPRRSPAREQLAGRGGTGRGGTGRGGSCVPSDTALCLNDGRFQVEVDWLKFDGEEGMGQDVGFGSDDSGLLWFFFPENWEMLVKVLDGCAFNGHYWVFSAAVTNVEYTLKVTDTANGMEMSYTNPLGTSADAVTDIEAFATCP